MLRNGPDSRRALQRRECGVPGDPAKGRDFFRVPGC